jgi:hypothetical protein
MDVADKAVVAFRSKRFHEKSVTVEYDHLTTEKIERVMSQMTDDGWEPIGMLLLPLWSPEHKYQVVLYFKHYCAGANGKDCLLCDPTDIPR